jgi:hypothetical protein
MVGRLVATLVVMANRWTPEQLLEAVQQRVQRVRLGPPSDDDRIPMQAEQDGGELLVTFRWPGEPQRLGLRFWTSEAPVGPSTGEICDSPDEWAKEVGWVLMEELDTGLVHRGRRPPTEQGVVELHYRSTPR